MFLAFLFKSSASQVKVLHLLGGIEVSGVYPVQIIFSFEVMGCLWIILLTATVRVILVFSILLWVDGCFFLNH